MPYVRNKSSYTSPSLSPQVYPPSFWIVHHLVTFYCLGRTQKWRNELSRMVSGYAKTTTQSLLREHSIPSGPEVKVDSFFSKYFSTRITIYKVRIRKTDQKRVGCRGWMRWYVRYVDRTPGVPCAEDIQQQNMSLAKWKILSDVLCYKESRAISVLSSETLADETETISDCVLGKI